MAEDVVADRTKRALCKTNSDANLRAMPLASADAIRIRSYQATYHYDPKFDSDLQS